MSTNQRAADDQVPGHGKPAEATGLVLAGGRSTRFKSDKSRYKYEGEELRVRVGKILKRVTGRTLLSVASPTIPPSPFDASVVDRFAQCGPLSGIHAGMLAAHADWLVVAPCDMPFVTRHVLRQMLENAISGEYDAVVASFAGRMIGVLGCYSTTLLTSLERRLQVPEASRSVDGFIRSLDRFETFDVSAVVATNINYVDDVSC